MTCSTNRAILNEKKLKEIEEELIKVFERLKDYFQTFEEDKTKKNYIDLKRDFNFIKLMEDELKQIFAKHSPSGKYKGHTSADDTGGDNPTTAGDIGNGGID